MSICSALVHPQVCPNSNFTIELQDFSDFLRNFTIWEFFGHFSHFTIELQDFMIFQLYDFPTLRFWGFFEHFQIPTNYLQ